MGYTCRTRFPAFSCDPGGLPDVFRFSTLLACLCLLAPLARQERVRLEAPAFSERVQAQVGRDAERAMATVEDRLGWTLDRPVKLMLVHEVSDLPESVRDSFVGRTVAVSLTHDYHVYLVRDRLSSAPPDDLRSTLLHEFVHSVLGDMELRLSGGSRTLPPWLHEGMAQWVAGAAFYPGGEELLYSNADWGRLLSWTDLGRRFPRDPQDRQLAYAQSLSFFSFLEARFGLDTLVRMVRDYLGGKSRSLGGALYQIEDTTIVDMEKVWVEWVLSNAGFLGIIKRRLFDFLLLLSVPILFLVLRRRNRREMEAGQRLEDHEEEMYWEEPEQTWQEEEMGSEGREW